MINLDLGGPFTLADGRNVVYGIDLTTGHAVAFFFTGHSTNTGNTTLTVCGEQIGINTAEDVGPIGVTVLAVDWYNSGLVSDAITDLTILPGSDRYTTAFSGAPFPFLTTIGAGAADTVTVTDNGTTGTSERGVLLLNDWNLLGTAGAPAANEATTIDVSAP